MSRWIGWGVVLALALTACGPVPTRDAPGGQSGAQTPANAPPAAGVEPVPIDDPEVRAMIARAKAGPLEGEELVRYSPVLLGWANRLAARGVVLPVNVPLVATLIQAYPDDERTRARIEPLFRMFIAELALKAEDPDAVGSLRAEQGRFVAGGRGRLKQIWTVGSLGLKPGGAIIVARHFMNNGGRLQTDDPHAPNYLAVSTDRAGVRFEVRTVPVFGMHGGFRGERPTPAFVLSGGELEPGDRVVIDYGGEAGMDLPSYVSERMPYPVYVDPLGEGMQFTLPIQPVVIEGAEVAGVAGFAPSVVAVGERFDVSVRAQDTWWNRASGEMPAWQVSANGRPLATLPAGGPAIQYVRGVSFDVPGVQRIEIVSADGRIAGVANPILVEAAPRQRIYWGDTHGHSGFAEGIGTARQFMAYARDDARLDFVTHSEHDLWLDDGEWARMRELVSEFTEPGKFSPFLGYEWTINNYQGGHHNVLFRHPEGRERVPGRTHPNLTRLYAGLRAANDPRDVLIIPHAHQAGDYRRSDPELERLVEIMSMHGTFEWFGRMYLAHGHRVGFVAASDNHLAQPGYSAGVGGSLSQGGGLGAVLAEHNDPDTIFDALRALHAYATTGERIILDVSVNGAGMGEQAPFSPRREISGRVIGTAPIESVAVIKNDAVIYERDLLTRAGHPHGDATLYVQFESASMPVNRGDNPRGWRTWKGRLRVTGAAIEGGSLLDLDNPRGQRLHRIADHVYAFTTFTRGDISTIALDLSGVSEATTINLFLEAATEMGGAPRIYRRPQRFAGRQVTLAVAEMQAGRHRVETQTAIGTDTITLRWIDPDGPRDLHFRYIDEDDPDQGDYYYVRVRQADDARAWSSPVWVGGYAPQ